jgi:hypothetical protein
MTAVCALPQRLICKQLIVVMRLCFIELQHQAGSPALMLRSLSTKRGICQILLLAHVHALQTARYFAHTSTL